MDKKKNQLGMNPSTASNRLVKDILFRLVVESGATCFHCHKALDRETFSVEHKVPWLDSANPIGLFFDQENIAFSHLGCNVAQARRRTPIYTKDEARSRATARMKAAYTTEARRDKFERTGY